MPMSLFDKYHVKYNILSVITNESVTKASYLYNFYKRNNFQFIQLIPCMDEQSRADSGRQNQYAVNPQQYGQFLNDLFDLFGMRILGRAARWISECFLIWRRWQQVIRQRNAV